MMHVLHVAAGRPSERIWIDRFRREVDRLGELTVVPDGRELPEDQRAGRIRRCDVLLTGWGSVPVPVSIAAEPGRLKYVCSVTGTVRPFVPIEIIDAGIPVTNWGDALAGAVAEGAFTLLLACLKDLPGRIRTVRAGGWKRPGDFYSGMLEGLNVGIYGCGAIGRRFVEMLRPFRPIIGIYDPYAAETPEGCLAVASLEELFDASEAIVIHAGLSDETRRSVTADLLARLPDWGVLVNTARGAIFDQDALFAELGSGRLRAGLDVLTPDRLPDDHPARGWPNVIFTAHDLSKYRPADGFPPAVLLPMHRVCLDNLKRFLAGEPLRFLIDRTRYERST